MLRKQALFAVFAVGLLVVGIAALAYRAYGPGGTLVHVAIRNYSFRPGDLAVRMGTTVRWVNMDFVEHTVSFGTHEDPTGLESPLLGHMGSFSYNFTEAGTYEYHCDPHPYMTGSVTVTP
jgi:plastocyanin